MPGVKRLFQESENSAKPEYIFGHMYGGIGAVIHQDSNYFCIPLDMSIQDGLKETSSWKDGDSHDTPSHVVQMIRNSYEITAALGSSYLVLDRYFLTVPALTEWNRLKLSSKPVDIITRAKSSCTAYQCFTTGLLNSLRQMFSCMEKQNQSNICVWISCGG